MARNNKFAGLSPLLIDEAGTPLDGETLSLQRLGALGTARWDILKQLCGRGMGRSLFDAGCCY